ncbi:MAG: response regulator [Magnetococcales bacterium]|nr:response regulator [Magnetococcales bacterium]
MDKRFILLVEDNPKDEMLTLRALAKHHVTNKIEVVRDGEEALNFLFGQGEYAARDTQDLPTVVLLDLKLPKMGGLQVLQEIRADQRTRLLPVVILTSSNEDRDILSGYQLGANSFVQKPIGFEEFSRSVAQLGLYWVLLNEPLPVEKVSV